MSRPSNCACSLPSCSYCNPGYTLDFQRMFRDWRDDEIDKLSARVKELELELSTTLRDVAANTAPLDMVDQLRKEKAELIENLVIAIGHIQEICLVRNVPLPKSSLDRFERTLAKARGEVADE